MIVKIFLDSEMGGRLSKLEFTSDYFKKVIKNNPDELIKIVNDAEKNEGFYG